MLMITEPPLRNKLQTENTDKKHIHQPKQLKQESAFPKKSTYAYYINRTLRDTKLRYKTD